MVKFRRGLNPQIQNAVATMASGRPSDMDPMAWYKMAHTVDILSTVYLSKMMQVWVSYPTTEPSIVVFSQLIYKE